MDVNGKLLNMRESRTIRKAWNMFNEFTFKRTLNAYIGFMCFDRFISYKWLNKSEDSIKIISS